MRDWDASTYIEKWSDPESPLLDALNVRWILTERDVTLPHKLIYDGPDGRIFENERALPRFYAPNGSRIVITHASGDAYELQVNASQPTLIESSVAFWPGWKVTHNGDEIDVLRVNRAFVGFVVPPGAGLVRVRYVPLSFWGGLAIAMLTIVVLITVRKRVARFADRP